MRDQWTEALAVRAVSALYEAALDEQAWPDALAAVRAYMGGSHPVFAYRHDRNAELVGICPETDPYWHQALSEAPEELNSLWREQKLRPAGSILVDWQLIDRDELRRSVFYNEYILPQDYHSTLHVNLLAGGSAAAYFCLGRPCRLPAFEQADAERFRILMPAFVRAARIFARTASAGFGGAVDGFSDLTPTAIFCVGADGSVVEANAAARKLISEPDSAVHLSGGKLRLSEHQDERRLRKALFEACAADRLGEASRGDVAVQSNGRLVGVLTVTPYVSRRHEGRPLAAVIWRPIAGDPDAGLAQRLQRLFDLTGREAELAVMLMSAPSLRAAGDRLSISFNTARSHLQRVMEKTDTHSQNGLMRLLASLGG